MICNNTCICPWQVHIYMSEQKKYMYCNNHKITKSEHINNHAS